MTKLADRIAALETQQQLKIDSRTCTDDELYAQLGEGYSLSLVPGDTRDEKLSGIINAYWGGLQLSPEARHAARGWFDVLDKI